MADKSDVTTEDVQSESGIVNVKRVGSPLLSTPLKRIKAWKDMTEEEQTELKSDYHKMKRWQHPWWDETDRPVSEPPDINYRQLIADDQETIEWLLDHPNLHFTDRCLRYQSQDLLLELDVLREYREWSLQMETATSSTNKERRLFFHMLHDFLTEDADELRGAYGYARFQEKSNRATRDLGTGGPLQFFDDASYHCSYYEETDGNWIKEPHEKGLRYEKRRTIWREQALKKSVQRYYDCVECRFYNYEPQRQHWLGENPVYFRLGGKWFSWEKETQQWRAPSWLTEMCFEHEEKAAAKLAAQNPKPAANTGEEEDSEGYQTAKEDAASPSSSTSP